MNWGWKITLVYIAFAAMIISFVVRARSNRIDLVTPDYYEQELVYEQKIIAQKNAGGLTELPTIEAQPGQFTVQFPSTFSGTPLSGRVHLYCPSDARRDMEFVLSLDPEMKQQLPAASAIGGHYIVQLSWTADGKEYYLEKPLSL